MFLLSSLTFIHPCFSKELWATEDVTAGSRIHPSRDVGTVCIDVLLLQELKWGWEDVLGWSTAWGGALTYAWPQARSPALRNKAMEAVEWAQPVTRLPQEQGDMGSVPRTHMEKPGMALGGVSRTGHNTSTEGEAG